MVLEAVMICVDNSEWMRNGDYSPSRFECQTEAVQLIASAKIEGNAETTVGLLTMAGNRIDVLLSPGRSTGAIMTSLAKDVRIGGKSNFIGALKTAQLALKNRPNKSQKQRLVVFVGSPIECESSELDSLGKVFKRNNISIDVINFGTENSANDNAEKLEVLINAINASDNSHLLNIPPGPNVLADVIVTSPILGEGGAAAAAAAGVGSAMAALGGSGAVDPNMDPELAMALRMSMEEEKARQQQRSAAEVPAGTTATVSASGGSGAAAGAGAGGSVSAGGGAAATMDTEETDEELLAKAIALSIEAANESSNDMQTESTNKPAAASFAPAAASTSSATSATSASASSSSTANSAAAARETDDIMKALEDPDFVANLMETVEKGGENNALLDNLVNDDKKDEKKDKDKQ